MSAKKPELNKAVAFMVETPDGVISKEENLQEYCLKHGLSTGNASAVLNGYRTHHKAYKFWMLDL